MKNEPKTSKIVAALAAASLFVGSSASAASTQIQTLDPLMAVSIFGTSGSQAAACAASTSATSVAGAAASAAADTVSSASTTDDQAAPRPGCVLPVESAPVAPAAQAPAMVAPTMATGGPNMLPLLIGLAAVVGGLALLLGNSSGDEVTVPVSPA